MAQVCDACDKRVPKLYRIASGQEVCADCYGQIEQEGPPPLPQQTVELWQGATHRVRNFIRRWGLLSLAIAIGLAVTTPAVIVAVRSLSKSAAPPTSGDLGSAAKQARRADPTLGWSRKEFLAIWGPQNGWKRTDADNGFTMRSTEMRISYTLFGATNDVKSAAVFVELEPTVSNFEAGVRLVIPAAIVSRVTGADLEWTSQWLANNLKRDLQDIIAGRERTNPTARLDAHEIGWMMFNEGVDGALIMITISPRK